MYISIYPYIYIHTYIHVHIDIYTLMFTSTLVLFASDLPQVGLRPQGIYPQALDVITLHSHHKRFIHHKPQKNTALTLAHAQTILCTSN